MCDDFKIWTELPYDIFCIVRIYLSDIIQGMSLVCGSPDEAYEHIIKTTIDCPEMIKYLAQQNRKKTLRTCAKLIGGNRFAYDMKHQIKSPHKVEIKDSKSALCMHISKIRKLMGRTKVQVTDHVTVRQYNLSYGVHQILAVYEQGDIDDPVILTHAVMQGNLDELNILLMHGFQFDTFTFDHAVWRNDMEIIKWCLDNKCQISDQAIVVATRNNNFECAKLIHSYYGRIPSSNAYAGAAYNGNLEMMQWLYSLGCPFNNETFSSAAENGTIENMQWLLARGCTIKDDALTSAIDSGKLDIIEWVYSIVSRPQLHNLMFANAATHNDEIIKWLIKKKCPLEEYTYKYALRYCRPDVADLLTKYWDSRA